MAFEKQPGIAMTFQAGEAMPNIVQKAVIFGTAENEILIGTADSAKFAGIVAVVSPGKSSANEGDDVTVVLDGVIEVTASGAIDVNAPLALAADGKVKSIPDYDDKTKVSAALASQYIGRALQRATADGDIITALVGARF